MSSPIFAPQSYDAQHADPRRRSPSFCAPSLDLVLRPSTSLGPFKLGHSLWHTLDYLRSHQSLFPHINVAYDQAAPRLSPVVVSIRPNLYLVFHGTTQRLIVITLDDLDQTGTDTGTSAASTADEPSHRPVNVVYNGKTVLSRGSSRSPAVVLNRSSLHQTLGPTFPGWSEARTRGVLASAPVKRAKADTEASEFILSYPGLAFTFAGKAGTTGEAEPDKFQPVSSIHVFCGTDPNEPRDAIVSPSTPESSLNTHDAARSTAQSLGAGRHKGALSPTVPSSDDYFSKSSERDRAALDTEAINVRAPAVLEAVIKPGRSVLLHFAKGNAARTPSPQPQTQDVAATEKSPASSSPHTSASAAVELRLGYTTPQDALCDLGSPQRVFYKEDDRMRIHTNGHGARGSSERDSESSSTSAANGEEPYGRRSAQQSGSGDGTASASFFYNYFDLGIDLLFSCDLTSMSSVSEIHSALTQGQPRLEKVICHTNVPGDALFQRYNRCPWRIAGTGKDTGEMSFRNAFTSASSSSSTAKNGGKSSSDAKESQEVKAEQGMELDRGTCAEFRPHRGTASAYAAGSYGDALLRQVGVGSNSSEVQLDLGTKLVGRDGVVLEVGKDASVVGVVVF